MNRRLPVVVILVALVVGALVLDANRDDRPASDPSTAADRPAMPIASDRSERSSTWFCAGGTADEEAFADHVVVIANPTDAEVDVALTIYGGRVLPPVADPAAELDPDAETTTTTTTEPDEDAPAGEGATTPTTAAPIVPVETVVAVGPYARLPVVLSELIDAPIASAVVEAQAGGIVVEHEVTSVHGYDAKPCSTEAADQWHFAWGDTTVDARELLVLFNPFPDDAIIDARFSTEDGVREPVRFDGLVVPGRGTLAVDLGDDVTRRTEVAGTITARTGRIIVDRIVRIDADDRRGLTVQLGVPRPQTAWVFPDGRTSEEVREIYVVYNPTEELAEVEIALLLDDPDANGIPEPVDLSLLPGTHETVDLTADGRIPEGVAHSAVVRSANGVPVVTERVLLVDGETQNGISVTTGSPVEAEEWTSVAGQATAGSDQWLLITNLDTQVLSEVSVVALAEGQPLPIADLQALEVPPSGRLAIRLGEYSSRAASIIVTGTEPIVVERSIYRIGGDNRGVTHAIGVPSPAGIRLPADPLVAEAFLPGDSDDVEDAPGEGDDDIPVAPDDVEMPEPDETIVIDDPDADATDPDPTTTATSGPTTTTTTNNTTTTTSP